MNHDDPPAPTLRSMNTDRTKRAILKAAQHTFSRCGYAEAGLRDIAAKAKVNQALIARYYGSKLKLFEAALEASLDVTHFTRTDRATFGATIADAFCGAGKDAASSVPMLVFAASDSAARRSALAILQRKAIEPLELWFGGPEASERAAQLLMVVTGFFTYKVMLPLEPLRGTPTPATRAWLARTLQAIVDA
ncbi:TetR/AcrR family transcriptional regulator [Novosphingobium resinovorum]|jgi:AcrR family transcriptional regulator|uniref:Transcriptional regulator, TetR family n=1 Tax=Novosphingobium resinovorum TaxID=158500 RepID=A0A031IXG8_9SPHN|nr:TetR/AcrR family transcriptional regulator [Novosphingobium resinovorum]AOR81055.1 hypothetical protein BES08_29620 [Novosphingobium resinovorum]EZP66274.1 Transcriptional regulator, TetR family [Novosphingobium resinovorum]